MRIRESVSVDAPRERVWELVSDPGRYAGLLEWATFTPLDPDREPGVGARYDMRAEVGSVSVGGVVEIVEYDAGCDVVWTNLTGLEQRGRVRVRSERDGRTRLTIRLSYDAPGPLLGTVAELVAMPRVTAAVQRSLRNVKSDAEDRERPAAAGPSLPRRVLHELNNVGILARSGLVAPMRPSATRTG